jgi:hypothetical protein
MKTIRVPVANQPRLLAELPIATISDQSGIEIVGEVQEMPAIEIAVEQYRPFSGYGA